MQTTFIGMLCRTRARRNNYDSGMRHRILSYVLSAQNRFSNALRIRQQKRADPNCYPEKHDLEECIIMSNAAVIATSFQETTQFVTIKKSEIDLFNAICVNEYNKDARDGLSIITRKKWIVTFLQIEASKRNRMDHFIYLSDAKHLSKALERFFGKDQIELFNELFAVNQVV